MDNTKLVKTKSKKKIVFLTLVLLCFVIGASYAIWNYVFTGEDNSITTSDISIDFLEDNDVISLTNALPISDDDGKNGEVFDFAVTTDTVREMGINYVLSIEKLPLEEGYTSLNDSDIKIYLTDENDNVLVEPTLISDLDNYQLYSNINMHNNINSTIKDKYKLRVWIDKDVSTNEWDENTLNQYMFRINVRAEQPSKYSITFNPNDGEVDISSKIVVNETQYGTLPIPIRANWIFDGWYTSIVGGTRVTSETIANLSSDQTLYARWKDEEAPSTPTVIRSDYNTFIYSATDNVGVTGYKITTTSEEPVATDFGWVTTTSFDIEQSSNTYYVWAKDADGNISVSKSIATYLVTRNEGTGTVLTTKLESSSGVEITTNTYVLSGTPVYIAGDLTTGYSSLSITVGGEPFTSGNVKTITSATTITSSAILNSHTVSVSVINGTISGDTQKEVENNNSTSFTFVPNNGYNSAVVNCTNEQISTFASNVLTVGPVTSDTMCTVIYESKATVLYEDGTLIINELESNRQANIAAHGEIMNTYNAMSESESYVFDIDYDNWSTNAPWFNEGESIISVEIGESIQPVSTSGWFFALFNFETGDFTNLDTSQVINMSSMFNDAGCDALSFNLIGLNNWNTSQVENMSSMFDYAGTSATTWDIGDLSNWNTSQVENMSSMFMQVGANATTWDIGDLSNWNTSQVENMSWMFSSAGYIATTWDIGDLSSWNTSKVTDMSGMFSGAGTSATTWDIGDLSSWDTSQVENMSSMFSSAGYIATTWDIGDLSNWNTSQVEDMNRMFYSTGDESTTFNSIGMLNIPSGCSLEKFAYTSSKFKGILILNGTPLNYDNMLDGTSTDASAYVNLYYTDSASQTFVEELITLYGPSGTSSQGNIYNMGQYVATP